MDETPISRHGAGRYEIRLEGRLHPRWAEWFDGLDVTDGRDGTTVLTGVVRDQSALHGVLRTVRDIGMHLVSVTRVGPDPDPHPPTTNRTTT